MKFFCVLTSLLLLFSPLNAIETALENDLVEKATAFRYENEFYVAVISEPIFLRSENVALCKSIQDKIEEKSGVKTNVVNDVGLYDRLIRLESLTGRERQEEINKIIMLFDRYINERY